MKAVMLHSLFRSGSTWLFARFRESASYWCYYEPLHHELARLRQDRLAVFRHSRRATRAMHHPHLDRPHFAEFARVFPGPDVPLPHFREEFAYHEFCGVRSGEALRAYLDSLLAAAPRERVPLLQFNRSSLRQAWCREQFPAALHLYLRRHPRHQFESHVQRSVRDTNIFLGINLLILRLAPAGTPLARLAPELLGGLDAPKASSPLGKQLFFFMKACRRLPLEPQYRVFLVLWTLSLDQALRCANAVLDMDALSASADARRQAERLLPEAGLPGCSLEDCRIRAYARHSLAPRAMRAEEEEVKKMLEQEAGQEVLAALDEAGRGSGGGTSGSLGWLRAAWQWLRG